MFVHWKILFLSASVSTCLPTKMLNPFQSVLLAEHKYKTSGKQSGGMLAGMKSIALVCKGLGAIDTFDPTVQP